MRAFFVPVALVVACGGLEAPEVGVTDAAGLPVDRVELSGANVGQSTAATLVVSNDGGGRLGPITLATSGSAAGDFVVGGTCAGATLVSGARCEIAIVFRPTAGGARAATLVIAAPSVAATVELIGHAVVPELHFVPAMFDFGRLEAGAQTMFELRNDGTSDAPIDAIAVGGAGFARGLDTCGPTLGPGASCDIVVTASLPALGPHTGTLEVVSAGPTYTAALTGRRARRLTVVVDGAGTIVSSPAGIDCGAACSELFEGDVELTASPGANAQLVGWSIAECGASSSCTVPAGLDPATVTATFALVGTSTLEIAFAGDADGEVQVWLDGQVTSCFASCTFPANAGQTVEIRAATAYAFGGFSGACVTPPGEGYCSLTLPVGTAAVTTTFTRDPKEQWTRLVAGRVRTAAFDGGDALVIGTANAVTKLSPLGATVWSVAMPAVSLAIGPADSIYVNTGTHVARLDAAGALVWQQPLDANSTGCGLVRWQFVHCLAVGSDGAVAVHGSDGFARWDATGVPTTSVSLPGSMHGIAIDPFGVVMVEHLSSGDGIDLRRFTADGTPLPTLEEVAPQYHGMFALDAAGHLLTSSSGHSDVYLRAFTPTPVSRSLAVPVASYVENGVAPLGTGDLAWLHFLDDQGNAADWKLARITAAGAEPWTLTRRRTYNLFIGPTGTLPFDIAGSPTGRIAVVGELYGLSATTGWVQTYVP